MMYNCIQNFKWSAVKYGLKYECIWYSQAFGGGRGLSLRSWQIDSPGYSMTIWFYKMQTNKFTCRQTSLSTSGIHINTCKHSIHKSFNIVSLPSIDSHTPHFTSTRTAPIHTSLSYIICKVWNSHTRRQMSCACSLVYESHPDNYAILCYITGWRV